MIPLLKKGDSLIAKNYRPVAILPIFSKILERVIFMQIVEYMDINKLFHPNHHGFRKHHNTTTALLQMYDSWIEGVENSELVGVCMLDMSAAFDVVSHQILLDKMKLYGFKEGAINWIKSYLNNRKQCVYIDGCLSKCLDVETGVPQGSILGPLFYVILSNDLPDSIHDHHDHDENEEELMVKMVTVKQNTTCTVNHVVEYAVLRTTVPTLYLILISIISLIS